MFTKDLSPSTPDYLVNKAIVMKHHDPGLSLRPGGGEFHISKFSINTKTCTMKTNVNLCKTTIFYCFFAVEDLESKLPVTYPRKNERQIDCKFET